MSIVVKKKRSKINCLTKFFFFATKSICAVALTSYVTMFNRSQPKHFQPEPKPDGLERDPAHLPETARGQAERQELFGGCRWWSKHHGTISRI